MNIRRWAIAIVVCLGMATPTGAQVPIRVVSLEERLEQAVELAQVIIAEHPKCERALRPHVPVTATVAYGPSYIDNTWVAWTVKTADEVHIAVRRDYVSQWPLSYIAGVVIHEYAHVTDPRDYSIVVTGDPVSTAKTVYALREQRATEIEKLCGVHLSDLAK